MAGIRRCCFPWSLVAVLSLGAAARWGDGAEAGAAFFRGNGGEGRCGALGGVPADVRLAAVVNDETFLRRVPSI